MPADLPKVRSDTILTASATLICALFLILVLAQPAFTRAGVQRCTHGIDHAFLVLLPAI